MGAGEKGGRVVREYYGVIRELLDEEGIVGCRRMDYLHLALAVRRIALQYLEEGDIKKMWSRIDGIVAYYATSRELKRELCYKIADRVVAKAKAEKEERGKGERKS